VQFDANTPFRPFGVLDVALTDTYYVNPLMENAGFESETLNPVTAESNRIYLTGAQVRIATASGEPVASDFFVSTSGTIDPGNYGGTTFKAIPNGYVSDAYAGQTVIVEFKVLGVTGGGLEVDTPWFRYPVDVCYGCLVKFPPEAWDDDLGCYDCNDLGTGGSIDEPCFFGNDEYVDCRLCAGTHPICTSPALNPLVCTGP